MSLKTDPIRRGELRMNQFNTRKAALAAASAIAISMAVVGAAQAQTSSSTLRGAVTESGQPAPGAVVTAVDAASGFSARATVRSDGTYVISGLRPGSYRVTVVFRSGAGKGEFSE